MTLTGPASNLTLNPESPNFSHPWSDPDQTSLQPDHDLYPVLTFKLLDLDLLQAALLLQHGHRVVQELKSLRWEREGRVWGREKGIGGGRWQGQGQRVLGMGPRWLTLV